MAAQYSGVRWLLMLFVAFMLNACMFDDDDDSDGSPVPGGIQLQAASLEIPSDQTGTQTVELSATVTDRSGNALPEFQVQFSVVTDNGLLSVAESSTDSSGKALTNLSNGNDPENRVITVSAQAGSQSATIDVQVTGTTLTLTGPEGLVAGDSGVYTALLADSAGAGVIGATLSAYVVESGNPDKPTVSSSPATDANGEAEITLDGNANGRHTLAVSALGLTDSVQVTILPDQFQFLSPASAYVASLEESVEVQLEWLSLDAPAVNQVVEFASTFGTLSAASANTDDSGIATVTISSDTPGTTVLTALDPARGTTASITIEFILATGLQTMQSGDDEREFYLQLPSDYSADATATAAAVGDDTGKPLLFLYHGYTGSYENWVGLAPDYDLATAYYDMVEVVGDDAIIVVPNGLPNASGQRVWGGNKDLVFFGDMLAELDRRGLQYNPNKIFVAGHSNGAGFTQELGCKYGDVIRGIVTAAGALTSTDCIGSTGVMLMQGSNDPLTSGALAAGALNYWVLYNGWDTDTFVPANPGGGEPCDDYSFPGELNSDYPVLWCEHTQGHDWPDFGSVRAWSFLQGLNEVEPTPDAPAGGGAERATPLSDANLTFQLIAPAEMNRPLRGVATLRAASWIDPDQQTCTAPTIILGQFSVDGLIIPGQMSEITFPITYLDFSGQLQFPSNEYALSITVYVEGGSEGAIPTPGVDYDAETSIALVAEDQDLIIPEPLTLAPVPNLCGF
jgi:poly(3-hydroxybutyrate) depolymerase